MIADGCPSCEKLRVVKQGASLYVMGTESIRQAAEALPPDVTGWESSHSGWYSRRQGRLRACSPEIFTPKDARPGVCFTAVRRAADVEIGGQS